MISAHEMLKIWVKYFLATAFVILAGVKIHTTVAVGLAMLILLVHLGGLGIMIIRIKEGIDELRKNS